MNESSIMNQTIISNEAIMNEAILNETIMNETILYEAIMSEYQTEFLNQTNITDLILRSIDDEIPHTAEYFSNLTTSIVIIIIIGVLLYIINLLVFCGSVAQSIQRVPKQYLYHTLFMISAYPIISTAALVTLFVPKSILITHTIMHLLFTICAVVFYQLCFLYVGGEENFLKEHDLEIMSIKTPPCCCCCVCFHNYVPSAFNLQILRVMNIQFPLIQLIIMIALNCFYIYAGDRYETLTWFFAPFMIASILTAMWSLNIVARMVHSKMDGINLLKKLLCLQLILIFCKFQFIILEKSLVAADFDGVYPITNTVYKYAIINVLILFEMIPLSLFVKELYKVPTFL